MAIVLRVKSPGMTTANYDEVVKRLEAAGAGSPAGRLFHVCFGDKDSLNVSDIWDSKESFDKFAQTLGPIMQELGVGPAEPEILEVHNIIEGVKTAAA